MTSTLVQPLCVTKTRVLQNVIDLSKPLRVPLRHYSLKVIKFKRICRYRVVLNLIRQCSQRKRVKVIVRVRETLCSKMKRTPGNQKRGPLEVGGALVDPVGGVSSQRAMMLFFNHIKNNRRGGQMNCCTFFERRMALEYLNQQL